MSEKSENLKQFLGVWFHAKAGKYFEIFPALSDAAASLDSPSMTGKYIIRWYRTKGLDAARSIQVDGKEALRRAAAKQRGGFKLIVPAGDTPQNANILSWMNA